LRPVILAGFSTYIVFATSSFDTTPTTSAITKLISTGTPEGEIIARVVRRFLDLTTAELSAALQDATEAAERRVNKEALI
jgi:hypothetical protein